MIEYHFTSVAERKECADAVLYAANAEHRLSVRALRKRSMSDAARISLSDHHKRKADKLRRAALVVECAEIREPT